jgi:AAA+ ATPase superfamily predicted ATPase
LKVKDPLEAIRAYSVWGGVPRYWELAAEHLNLDNALQHLVLSPLGALHEEPTRILLDDLRDMTQVNSILSLIGRGCHRSSEIAGRLGKPATSLSRPLQRLVELGLIRRMTPFGVSPRQSKRTIYKISDPFLLFWFRFVEPNRSQLEARQTKTVALDIRRRFPQHLGDIWEELARESVARTRICNRTWRPASRWWGANLAREQMEIDVVAESSDRRSLLLGEAKWADKANPAQLLRDLQRKAERAPFVQGRKVYFALWLKQSATVLKEAKVLRPRDVLRSLR